MLQNKFEMPLDLAVKNSKIFHTYFFIIFLLAIVSIFISSLLVVLQLFLVVTLIAMALLTLKKQNVNKITRLLLSCDDKWQIEINNEQSLDAELQGECIVTYFLVWLNFTTSNSLGSKKIFHVLLLSDSVDKDLFRQLRVRLRFLKYTNEVDDDEGSENLFHH